VYNRLVFMDYNNDISDTSEKIRIIKVL